MSETEPPVSDEKEREASIIASSAAALWEANKTPGDPTWLYDPPYLDEYVESRNYLGYKPLSRGQRSDAIALLGENPKEIFSGGSIYTIAVLLHGKGGGKDFLAAILQSYVKQVTRMMRDSHGFFSMAPNEDISLINISLSQDHAINIYFKKFVNCMLSNAWYRDKYSIYKGNSLVQMPGNIAGRPRMDIHAGEVYLSDAKLLSKAFGSDNESAEGGSPIWFCMDEASAFKQGTKLGNADKIYSTLRTSCASRFGKKWKGMIISYPRSEVDFTVRMYEQSQRQSTDEYGNTVYGSKRTTWEAREEGAFKLPPFEFQGMMIPGDFKDEFNLYPEESLQKFACRPPAVENPFITYPGRIYECVKTNQAPIFTTQDCDIQHIIQGTEEMKKYVGKMIDWIKDKSYTTLKTPRVIHVDGGLTNNRAGLVLAHGEPVEINIKNQEGILSPTYVNKVIVDAALYWQPNKKLGLQVSLNNIEAIIMELMTFLNIVCVTYDQWNSQTSLETLQAKGVRALEHTISNDDYYELRSMIYAGGVELLPPEYDYGGLHYQNPAAALLLQELKRLKIINGKVDHPNENTESGSKDLADALCGVTWSLNEKEQKRHNVGGFPKGLIGPAVSSAQPSPFSAASQGIPGGIEPIIGMNPGRTPAGGVPVGGFRPVDPRTGAPGRPAMNRPSAFPKGVVSSPGFNRAPSPGQRGTGAVPPYLL